MEINPCVRARVSPLPEQHAHLGGTVLETPLPGRAQAEATGMLLRTGLFPLPWVGQELICKIPSEKNSQTPRL